MHWLELKIPPVAVLLLTVMLQWVLASTMPALAIFDFSLRTPVALALLLLGLGIAVSGVVSFRRSKTTVSPTNPGGASAMVHTGPYRFSRNPMYLGMLLGLGAVALHFKSGVSLATLPLFVAYLSRFQIVPEERFLAAKFGPIYEAYRQRVRRWV
jgi:protein-S-isoprenylcysteine O-methyltransferase Ste14